MELTIKEKLDRLEAGLAEIGKRLDALEAAQCEGFAQWEADRVRWAAEPMAGGVERWPAQEEERTQEDAADDDEEWAFSEALERLDMTFLNSAHPCACPKP